jgi:hypothetical protein
MKRANVQKGRIPLAVATRATKGLGIQGDEEVGFPKPTGIGRH